MYMVYGIWYLEVRKKRFGLDFYLVGSGSMRFLGWHFFVRGIMTLIVPNSGPNQLMRQLFALDRVCCAHCGRQIQQ